ncbi:MAG: 23S rRNA (uracil(1939)-C(5))-methyltransferase RlmD, partial [Defluviitaleaceae bacterium]|nr:23S rRNA (uracil(1939)-C(5))-methyltransferase RlmD [Defluviitaleaceae bacterium]
KNETVMLTIHDLHSNGHGVGKGTDGIAVFVSGALPGDELKAKIIKVKKHYAYGRIVEIIKPSPQRLSVDNSNICPVSERCGGCQYQCYDYAAQLAFKEKLVRDALVRIGHCEAPPMAPILGMDKPYRYRNKAQFPVGQENGKPVVGFYAPRSHRIVPIMDCNIHHPACGEVLRVVQGLLEAYPIPIYNEETHTGLLRHVVVRVGFNTGRPDEVMVIFVLNGRTLPDDCVEAVKNALPATYTLVINENKARTNVILGSKFTVLQGSGYIHEMIGDIRYRISPKAFFQVNPAQTKVLYDVVAGHLNGGERVVDAYSGIGGIALYIADKAQNVVAIESVAEAVDDGIYNAALNNIENVKFLCGPAEDLVPDLLAQNEGFDVLILDPPRKGCDSRLLEAAISVDIPKIIYVSCDPATLARDVKLLGEGGYHITHVQPVDLFPMTGHVETVCVLKRK